MNMKNQTPTHGTDEALDLIDSLLKALPGCGKPGTQTTAMDDAFQAMRRSNDNLLEAVRGMRNFAGAGLPMAAKNDHSEAVALATTIISMADQALEDTAKATK